MEVKRRLVVFKGSLSSLRTVLTSSQVEPLVEDALPATRPPWRPEAIVISYSYGQDRKATVDFVATRLADTPAVYNGRVIDASETYFAGELRSAPAITELARGLHGAS